MTRCSTKGAPHKKSLKVIRHISIKALALCLSICYEVIYILDTVGSLISSSVGAERDHFI